MRVLNSLLACLLILFSALPAVAGSELSPIPPARRWPSPKRLITSSAPGPGVCGC